MKLQRWPVPLDRARPVQVPAQGPLAGLVAPLGARRASGVRSRPDQMMSLVFQPLAARRWPSGLQATQALKPLSLGRRGVPRRISSSCPEATSQT